MSVPVNVYIVDSSSQANPVVGATLCIFDPATLAEITMGVSDSNGKVSLLLPGMQDGQTYEARFFKMGYVFPNPMRLVVFEPAVPETPNGFSAVGTQFGVFGLPIDPRLCRCVGRFLDYTNQPVVNGIVRISSDADLKKKTPMVVDGNLIASGGMELHTDNNGFISVDLLRSGEYFITLTGETEETWNFKVPDTQTANLIDLIHPYPVSLTWGIEGTQVVVAVGQQIFIPLSVTFSDFIARSSELQDMLQFMNSDETTIDLVYMSLQGQLAVTGKALGQATISVEMLPDLFPRRVPDYSINAPVLAVTVVSPS